MRCCLSVLSSTSRYMYTKPLSKQLPLRQVTATAPSTTQWSPNWDPPPVSRKLQHGATTSVERSSTIQASTPQAFSAQQRLEPLQMAPDFRHPSTHPLFSLDCAAAALCCFVSIFIYFSATHFAIDDAANPSQLVPRRLIFCSLQLALNLCQ